MATMKEVARKAGVSVATVSRVINKTAYVEPVTRERVEKAMREFNYHRNAAALALAKRSGNMLGLLTGNLDDPFFSRLARGVEDITHNEGVKLMVCSGGHLADLEQNGLDFLINQGCEAIVAHLTRMNDNDILRYAAHIPALVLVNRYLPTISNRCIWLDNISATHEATTMLIRNGHTKIACITADIPIDDKKHRIEGYLLAMANAGIIVPNSWIISVPFNEKGGELAAEKLLASDHSFTAVLTFNDLMAAGMMRTFHHKNIRMPDDISIVGFDDIPLAKYLHPSLTTVHYPVEKIARRAAKLALRLHSGASITPQLNKFTAELILRDSVINLKKNDPNQ
ncbi:transcriptional regulator [Serratia sp. S1B]|nr:transcriptional regulator [Serratia sp. S1B]